MTTRAPTWHAYLLAAFAGLALAAAATGQGHTEPAANAPVVLPGSHVMAGGR